MRGEANPTATAGAAAPAGVRVRRARLEDAAPLAQLSHQLGYPSSPGQVRRRLRDILASEGHAVFVAEDSAEAAPGAAVDRPPAETGSSAGCAGWVHAFVERTVESEPTVEIGGLVVDQARRGAGVGRLLMESAERWAGHTGCATVTVRSNILRTRAHSFYEGLGYALVKTQRVYRKALAG